VAMPTGRWHARCPSCQKDFYRHRRPQGLAAWFCLACGEARGPLRFRRLAAGTAGPVRPS
jgi:ribosomal protein L37AE/L43A